MRLQLVIPCFNEAPSLASMVTRTIDAAKNAGLDESRFQLIIVDNGSTDDTQLVLNDLNNSGHAPWLITVTVERNKGYGHGLKQGLEASSAAFVGWTHADEQCDPADVFRALALLSSDKENVGRTLVKGRRENRGAFDFIWSRFFEMAVLFVLRIFIWEINAQPKVFARRLLLELGDPPLDFAFDLYVLYQARRAGWRIKSIPVKLEKRIHGESRWAYSFKSRCRTSLRMFRYICALAARKNQPASSR